MRGPDLDPGVAVRTAVTSLITIGDGTSFPTAAHLSSYVGLAPTTKFSETSIHGEHAPHGGNRQFERATFLSAFAALHDRSSRTYYDKCRVREKPTPRHSSIWPDNGSTCCSRCSATAPSTNPEPHASLDERHKSPRTLVARRRCSESQRHIAGRTGWSPGRHVGGRRYLRHNRRPPLWHGQHEGLPQRPRRRPSPSRPTHPREVRGCAQRAMPSQGV